MNHKPRKKRNHTFFKMTLSTCPECLALVETQVIFENKMVYFVKHCPQHGMSKALVSESEEYYRSAYKYGRPGSMPHKFSTAVKDGCPRDCGLCENHQQHTCLSIVEITDHCNLQCPICIANNQNAHFMSVEDFGSIIENLISTEGSLETIAFSGGEPTMHPEFFKLVQKAKREEIGRIAVATNGIKIGQSKEFCQRLKEENIYVLLQLDGLSDDVYQQVRGAPLLEMKEKALANLAEFEIPTQLVFVPIKGINDHQLGDCVDLLLTREHILCLLIQPVSYSGKGGGTFPQDPLDRITIPGVTQRIEEQTGGKITQKDFIPLPCSHPHCVSLMYLLRLNDGSYTPFSRFVDMENQLHLFEQSATMEPTEQVEDTMQAIINDLWSSSGEDPSNEKTRKALKRALLEMFPDESRSRQELIQIAENQAKSIFIHHYMDRHNFDLERLIKCCHHYPQVDGRIMPACGFNMFHRGSSKGENSPIPAWGKGPFQK